MHIRNLAGFTVIFCPSPSPVTSVRVLVNAGSLHETQPGTAHFLEHMFFKGTETMSAVDMNRTIAAIGESNAFTASDRTVYYINTTTRNATKALKLLCEMLFHPAMNPDDIEKERGVIQEEWQASQDNPATFFVNRCLLDSFGDTVGHAIVGTKESIEDLTRDHLVDFRNQHYTRNNIAFVIAGDLGDYHDIEAVLVNYSAVEGTFNPYLYHPVTFGAWSETMVTNFQHESSQAWIGLVTPGMNALEGMNLGYATDVLHDVLGGGMHSMLFDRIREQLGLAYSVGSMAFPIGLSSPFLCYALTSKENVDQCIVEMQGIIEEIAAGKIPSGLLETAMDHYEFVVSSGVETTSGIAAYANDYFMMKDFWPTRPSTDTLALEVDYGFQPHMARFLEAKKDMAGRVSCVASRMLEGASIFVMNGESLENL
jgi:predicted Zn-dependent peptidase